MTAQLDVGALRGCIAQLRGRISVLESQMAAQEVVAAAPALRLTETDRRAILVLFDRVCRLAADVEAIEQQAKIGGKLNAATLATQGCDLPR